MSHGKLVALLVPATAAAAAALVTLRLHFEPPTVPLYALEPDTSEVTLARGGQFAMNVHPLAPVKGAIGARAFLVRGDEVRPWDPPFSVASDGSVRISGPVDALFAGVPKGRWEVALTVGRPEVLPTAPTDVLRARSESDRPSSWRLVCQRVRIEE